MTGRDVQVELRTVAMPLVTPFRTSRATESAREVLLVRWTIDNVDGWAECGADPTPAYYPESLEGVRWMIEHIVLPLLVENGARTAAAAHDVLRRIPRNPLAKAVVESAILDSELRAANMSLQHYLGGTRTTVPVGVSIGIADSEIALLETVAGHLEAGYRRIKLKIAPGWDIGPIKAVRHEFGDALALQVDANQAYTVADLITLRRLDDFDLQLLEQPLPAEDLLGHAHLAELLRTPICLDESIGSAADAATALALGATQVINIKPARVGGYLEARAIHDMCLAQSIPVWCGGLLETGIGRASNLQLASLPGFTMPGDISATDRYYATDIAQRFELVNGELAVPTGPGSGAVVDGDAMDEFSIDVRQLDLTLAR